MVIEPPRATAEPLIVICPEPCKAAFATEVLGKVIFAPVGTVIVSPLSLTIWIAIQSVYS